MKLRSEEEEPKSFITEMFFEAEFIKRHSRALSL